MLFNKIKISLINFVISSAMQSPRQQQNNDENHNNGGLDEEGKVSETLRKLRAENDFNPKRLTLDVRNAR